MTDLLTPYLAAAADAKHLADPRDHPQALRSVLTRAAAPAAIGAAGGMAARVAALPQAELARVVASEDIDLLTIATHGTSGDGFEYRLMFPDTPASRPACSGCAFLPAWYLAAAGQHAPASEPTPSPPRRPACPRGRHRSSVPCGT
jgi:hypothetical protein